MAIEHTQIDLREKDLNTLCAVFAAHPEVEAVYLFGSRARGEAKRASDIDLAIAAPGMSRAVWSRLVAALDEAPVILFIDAVRLDALEDAPLRERIAAEGVQIYRR